MKFTYLLEAFRQVLDLLDSKGYSTLCWSFPDEENRHILIGFKKPCVPVTLPPYFIRQTLDNFVLFDVCLCDCRSLSRHIKKSVDALVDWAENLPSYSIVYIQ